MLGNRAFVKKAFADGGSYSGTITFHTSGGGFGPSDIPIQFTESPLNYIESVVKTTLKNSVGKSDIEAEQIRQTRKKMTIREFEPLTIIGRGAFGEVRVCRQISNGDIVAIKKMRKEDMLVKNQLMHVRTEKEIMTIMFYGDEYEHS